MLQRVFPKSRAATVIAVVIVLFLIAHIFLDVRPSLSWSSIYRDRNHPAAVSQEGLPCHRLHSAGDLVVVLRTGATEIQDKLPVHLNTTFRCYDDFLVFSDYEETFHGHKIHDVLASVDPAWKETHDDFEIYRRLQQRGRAGLRLDELSGSASFEGSKSGKTDNPGWRLDKWKFLPMMRETIKLRPDKNWYVFLETDSYVVWSNLLQWLPKLDPSKSLYYGSENQIGPDIYAHGGSVFVMSRSAVQRAAAAYTEQEEKWNKWTAGHWAGDCVLGKALLEEGVPLTWAFPMFQGGNPEKMDFSEVKPPNKKLWCLPALSYHHFSPTELERMWQFEQGWIQSREEVAVKEHRRPWQDDKKDVLHHRDVFRDFILPNITTTWYEWNNLSPDLVMASNNDFEACRHLCEQSLECLQFSVGPPGCSISTKAVMLGQRGNDYQSYWVMDRVEKWMTDMDQCDGHDDWMVT